MKRRLSNERFCTPRKVFLIGLQLLVVLMIIQLPLQDGKSFFSLLHSDLADTYMDFFNSIHDASKSNPYVECGVIYPPLTYLFYRLCAYLLPVGCSAIEWRNSQSGIMLMSSITVLSMALLYRCLLPEECENKDSEKRLILWCILSTVPFWYVIERGNLMLQTMVALAYFLKYRKSSKLWRRETALISLGIATAFKIYPVVFGLLLLKDRQFKEAIRCIIYGAIIFFVPFCFFGGLSNLGVMISNIFSTGNKMAMQGWGYKVNLDNTISFLSESLHCQQPNSILLSVAFASMIAFVFFFTEKEWQQYMSLCTIMILFPKFSFTYTLIVVVIPLLVFLQKETTYSTRNLLFSILFLCMLAPFPFDGYALFDAAPVYYYTLNLTTVVSSFALLGMVLLMAIDVFCSRIGEVLSRKPKCKQGKPAEICFLVIIIVLITLFLLWYIYCNHLFYENLH